MNKQTVINLLAIAVVGLAVVGAIMMKSEPPKPADQSNEQTTTTQPSEAAAANAPDEATANDDAPRPRLVDFGSDKCIPCKKLAPILAELKKEYAGRLDIVIVDVYKDPMSKQLHGIGPIPTQILFDANDEELWRHVGFIDKEALIKVFAEKAGVKQVKSGV